MITVLTNSFMAIASNATEEHQFLFAINTISMVKNDALFSYIAPSNIFAWLLMPLRYCMPLRQFVWLNRTVIKVTHFPVLFCIYLYERLWLAPTMFEPTDLIENPTRGRERNLSFADPSNRTVFSPNVRVREESVAGFHKDRALEEVFRRMPEPATLRTQRRNERHKAQTAIRNWMDQHVAEDGEGGSATNWPTMHSQAAPDWQRRLSVGWDRPSNLRQVSEVRSVASDPADLLSNIGGMPSIVKRPFRSPAPPLAPDYKEHTDADGDDELVTNDEDEDDHGTNAERSHKGTHDEETEEEQEDYFTTPMTSRVAKLPSSRGSSAGRNVPTTPRPSGPRRSAMHNRTLSTNTILYNPPEDIIKAAQSSSSASPGRAAVSSGKQSRGSGEKTPRRRSSPRRKSPQRNHATTKPRPVIPPRGVTETGGVSRSALLSMEPRHRPRGGVRRLSSVDLSVLSDNTSLHFGNNDVDNGGMAGSFQTQMAMAMMKDDQRRRAAGGVDAADRDRMGRLVLARMKTLEESFAEMIKEMRDMKERSAPPTRRNSDEDMPVKESKGKKSGTTTPRRVKGRPVSRRSLKETSSKAKGKGVAYSTDDEADGGDDMLKGSSL